MICMKNVNLTYDNGTCAIKNLDLEINDGEFVFIIGQSGAGKSSIFKLLTREVVATDGLIVVNDQNLSRLKPKQIPYYKRTIGMIFQDFRLIPNMTVFDNVAFVLRVTNYSLRYIKKRVPAVLEMVDLLNEADKFPNELSGGEQQRVAIARSIASNPPILIADEPTGNIDPALSEKIVKLLYDINKYLGVTLIMVTHDHEIVNNFGGRVIKINDGQIEEDRHFMAQNEMLINAR